MASLLTFLLVVLLIALGVTYLITKAISYKSEKEGKELLQYLRNNPYDVRKILGEMRYIAEVNFKLYNECAINMANTENGGIISGTIYALTHRKRQNELGAAMNHYVKAEWDPRLKFLKEIQNAFRNDSDLYYAFIECRDIIDKDMQKLTFRKMANTAMWEHIAKGARIGFKAAAWTTIATVAIGGAILNKSGKDIGYSPKSGTRYRDA